MVRLSGKWYDFSTYQPYTAAGKAIPPLAKPDTAWGEAVPRVRARARACAARDKFGKYLSPSPTRPRMPCTKAFRPSELLILPSPILHLSFAGEGSVKVR